MNKYLYEIDIYKFSYNEIDEKYNELINYDSAEYGLESAQGSRGRRHRVG